MKTGYLLVHIPATHHCGRRYNRMGGGRDLSVLEVNLLYSNTWTGAQNEFRFTLMGTIFKDM